MPALKIKEIAALRCSGFGLLKLEPFAQREPLAQSEEQLPFKQVLIDVQPNPLHLFCLLKFNAMAEQIFDAEQLKQIFTDLIDARHITLEQAQQQVRDRYKKDGRPLDEEFLPSLALKRQQDDLVDTLIEAIPELIARNNQQLLKALNLHKFE